MIYLSIFIQQVLFYIDLLIQKKSGKKIILIITLIVISILIGLRKNFPDQIAYEQAFDLAPSLTSFSTENIEIGYAETGYFIPCVYK